MGECPKSPSNKRLNNLLSAQSHICRRYNGLTPPLAKGSSYAPVAQSSVPQQLSLNKEGALGFQLSRAWDKAIQEVPPNHIHVIYPMGQCLMKFVTLAKVSSCLEGKKCFHIFNPVQLISISTPTPKTTALLHRCAIVAGYNKLVIRNVIE